MPIIRAKKGELEAHLNLLDSDKSKMLPVFDIPKFTNKTGELVICRNQPNPIECYLNDIVFKIASVRSQNTTMIDIHDWAPNANTESGEHVLAYACARLTSLGTPIIPIIGYDRWDDKEYAESLSNLKAFEGRYCIRLESYAFEDMMEDVFLDNIEDIISELGLDTTKCNVILDFRDVTKESIDEIQEKIVRSYNLLDDYNFSAISIAGCSITKVINEMVSKENSSSIVLRREMLAFQACKKYHNMSKLVFGDYGVVNPDLQDGIIAPDANGKIRYTIGKNYFVLRGYSRRKGDKGAQMYKLCQQLIDSEHYMQKAFSWGDGKIHDCSEEKIIGNLTNWVSFDSNHHMKAVLAEVYEFETTLVSATVTT